MVLIEYRNTATASLEVMRIETSRHKQSPKNPFHHNLKHILKKVVKKQKDCEINFLKTQRLF